MNQIVKFGEDSISHLSDFLNQQKPNNIFLVTGKKSYEKCGAKAQVQKELSGYNFVRFSDFEENPKIEDVEKGVRIFKENKCDLIIAVGGGSAIDIGKLVNFFKKKEKPFTNQFKSDLSKNESCPFVAIPTTAGAGSEATHFAVVYVNKIKYSIANKNLTPNLVLINHIFLKSQSKYQMTVSGLDAFCQGVESFWCVNSNEESLEFSRKAIIYSWTNLKNAVEEKDGLYDLAKASYFAGKAINITKTTGPHALSYGFTTNFNIPHGHAVSLFLPFFISFHKTIADENCNDYRGFIFVINQMKKISELLGVEYDNFEFEILNFFKILDIEINFEKLGISFKDFKKTLENINKERLKNNPRLLLKKDLNNIYYFNVNN